MKIAPDMETADRSSHEYMRDDEITLMFFRKHGISLLFKIGRRWFLAFLVFLFLFWIQLSFITFEGFYVPAQALYFFNIIYSLFLLHWFFVLFINHFLNFIIITNRNIVEVHKTIFMHEDMNQIPFEYVHSVHHDKSGILSNFLQYGTLQVESSSTHQNIRMHYVARSEQKAIMISEIHGDYIAAPETDRERA